jgi:hypothetical protein
MTSRVNELRAVEADIFAIDIGLKINERPPFFQFENKGGSTAIDASVM